MWKTRASLVLPRKIHPQPSVDKKQLFHTPGDKIFPFSVIHKKKFPCPQRLWRNFLAQKRPYSLLLMLAVMSRTASLSSPLLVFKVDSILLMP